MLVEGSLNTMIRYKSSDLDGELVMARSSRGLTLLCFLAASADPLKHCHLLIQELEITEIQIRSELEALGSDEEDSL